MILVVETPMRMVKMGKIVKMALAAGVWVCTPGRNDENGENKKETFFSCEKS